MDLHPAIVHFPIALLTVYSVLEALSFKWDSDKWRFARQLLLFIGFLGSVLAYITGQLTGAEGEIAQMHELFATITMSIYGLSALVYILHLKRIRSIASVAEFLFRPPIRVLLAALGVLSLTITGALGGIMVYGPVDPVAQLVHALLIE